MNGLSIKFYRCNFLRFWSRIAMSASMPRLETPSVLEEFSSAKKKIQEKT